MEKNYYNFAKKDVQEKLRRENMTKFKTSKAIESLLNKECLTKLGIMFYTKVSHSSDKTFLVKFYISNWTARAYGRKKKDIFVLKRSASISEKDIIIDFPTKKQIDEALKKQGMK